MPRGDGRASGDKRQKWDMKYPLQTYIPPWLVRRLEWWDAKENGLTEYRDGDKHDGKGNSYRRPGSQQR